MRQTLRVLLPAMLACCALLSTLPSPAAAWLEVWNQPFKAIWDDTDIVHLKGIVIVDGINSGRPRVILGATSDLPNEPITFSFRSISCGGSPRNSNRVFTVRSMTDENGSLYVRMRLSTSIDFGDVKSVWANVDHTACVPVQRFQRVATGDVNGDGALGLMTDKATPKLIVVAEPLSSDQIRVAISVHGSFDNDDLLIRGVNKACGKSPAKTIFSLTVNDVTGSKAQNTAEDFVFGFPYVLRSMRIRNLDTGKLWCAPLSIIMANTEGDFH